MYKKMLVLLDGSKLSEVVFSYAQELSARLHLTLDLLHVCNPGEADQLPMRQAYMEHMAERLQNEVEATRLKIGGAGQGKSIQAHGKVVVGYPAEEILKYADENKVDLIMLSTHGRSGIKIWGLGNVANKVIHAAKVPIWLVPAELREEIIEDTLPKRTTVIPLDGSKRSEAVIPYVTDLIKQRGAQFELILLYVEWPTHDGGYGKAWVEHLNETRLTMKKYLDEQVQRLAKEGISARSEILMGDPAAKIIDFVKDNPTYLIAMASHGHTGISRMIFDNTTEQVMHLVKKTPIFIARTSD